jgi:hypothetical protein
MIAKARPSSGVFVLSVLPGTSGVCGTLVMMNSGWTWQKGSAAI